MANFLAQILALACARRFWAALTKALVLKIIIMIQKPFNEYKLSYSKRSLSVNINSDNKLKRSSNEFMNEFSRFFPGRNNKFLLIFRFRNKFHQGSSFRHKIANFMRNFGHFSALRSFDDVLHFHCDHDHKRITGFDLIAILNINFFNDTCNKDIKFVYF